MALRLQIVLESIETGTIGKTDYCIGPTGPLHCLEGEGGLVCPAASGYPALVPITKHPPLADVTGGYHWDG